MSDGEDELPTRHKGVRSILSGLVAPEVGDRPARAAPPKVSSWSFKDTITRIDASQKPRSSLATSLLQKVQAVASQTRRIEASGKRRREAESKRAAEEAEAGGNKDEEEGDSSDEVDSSDEEAEEGEEELGEEDMDEEEGGEDEEGEEGRDKLKGEKDEQECEALWQNVKDLAAMPSIDIDDPPATA